MLNRLEAIPSIIPEKYEYSVRSEDELLGYLAGIDPEQPATSIGDNLNLGLYKSHLRKVEDTSNIVNRHTESEIMSESDFQGSGNEILDILLSLHTSDYISEKCRIKVSGEVGSVIFYNHHNEGIQSTPVMRGEYASVPIGKCYLPLLEDRYISLLEVHTHPRDSMPSVQDYGGIMTTSLYRKGERLVRGMVVLNRTHQILGLATDKTPIYHPGTVTEEINKLNENMANFFLSNLTDAQINYRSMSRSLDKRLDEIVPKIAPHIEELNQMREQYALTSEAVMDAIRSIIGQQDPTLFLDYEAYERVAIQVKVKEGALLEAGLLKVAEELKIKLFSATDYQNFTAFSA